MSDNPVLASKDPSDVKDYAIDWSVLLTAEGETTINTSTWAVSVPTGLTINSSTTGTTTTIVWVSAGTSGVTYGLTNTIVTAGGRTHERTIFIPCLNR